MSAKYLLTKPGIAKILQIVLGLLFCKLLCYNIFSDIPCKNDDKVHFVAIINFLFLITNILLFMKSLLNGATHNFELFYSGKSF